MPDQPADIEQRISDVMRTHRFERHSESRDGYFAWWGHCTGCAFESDRRNSNYVGWELDMRDDEARHVAEVLVSELLTREQRELADGMGGVSTNYESGQVTIHSRPCTRQSRYVTEWSDE